MRFNVKAPAVIGALVSGALLGSPVRAAEPTNLPVYEVAAASPPVTRVIGPVRVRECHVDAADARGAALAKLSQKAAAEGANGLVNVRVEVGEANQRTIKNGAPNPCLFQTVAKGDAAVLAGAAQLANQRQ
ncbi:hypothetical protein [Phenylobacterium sp.]|uniref:hypothetical protein n=1 Tax=Phenylobacterium sp. TaxID=1871053 RepID=UPI001209C3BB|nr:hypothetical protein [Phenylobacterium sp.]THD61286.1 MAG: hypothetical protein E8A49_09775 [Phenylobacterium sp.]